MLDGDLILPHEIRNDKQFLCSTVDYFEGLNKKEIDQETKILSNCNKEQFYQLLKNEPFRYLSLIEHSPELNGMATKNDFYLKRDQNSGILQIRFSVKDEYPIILESDPDISTSDQILADDLLQYITAKNKEQCNMGQLPKRTKYKEMRKKLDGVNDKRIVNPKNVIDVMKYLDQIEELVKKTRQRLMNSDNPV